VIDGKCFDNSNKCHLGVFNETAGKVNCTSCANTDGTNTAMVKETVDSITMNVCKPAPAASKVCESYKASGLSSSLGLNTFECETCNPTYTKQNLVCTRPNCLTLSDDKNTCTQCKDTHRKTKDSRYCVAKTDFLNCSVIEKQDG